MIRSLTRGSRTALATIAVVALVGIGGGAAYADDATPSQETSQVQSEPAPVVEQPKAEQDAPENSVPEAPAAPVQETPKDEPVQDQPQAEKPAEQPKQEEAPKPAEKPATEAPAKDSTSTKKSTEQSKPASKSTSSSKSTKTRTVTSSTSTEPTTVHVKQSSLTDHYGDCKDGNNTSGQLNITDFEGTALTSVTLSDGSTVNVAGLSVKTVGNVRQYDVPLSEGVYIVDATATVPAGWSGQFVLSHYECGTTTPVTPEGSLLVTSPKCETIAIDVSGVKPADAEVVTKLDGEVVQPGEHTATPGQHTVTLYVNGELVDTQTVTVEECTTTENTASATVGSCVEGQNARPVTVDVTLVRSSGLAVLLNNGVAVSDVVEFSTNTFSLTAVLPAGTYNNLVVHITFGEVDLDIPVETVVVGTCDVTPPPVSATAPTKVDLCEPASGPTNDAVVIPEDSNFDYSIDGAAVSGVVPVTGTSATVVATPKKGVVVEEGSQLEWTFTFTKAACEVPPTPAKATAPTMLDKCEPADALTEDEYTVPSDDNFTYTVNGEVTAAGTYPATETTYVVVAVPNDGVVAEEGTQTTWTFTFTKVACEVPPVVFMPAGSVDLTCTGGSVVMDNSKSEGPLDYTLYVVSPNGKLADIYTVTLAAGEVMEFDLPVYPAGSEAYLWSSYELEEAPLDVAVAPGNCSTPTPTPTPEKPGKPGKPSHPAPKPVPHKVTVTHDKPVVSAGVDGIVLSNEAPANGPTSMVSGIILAMALLGGLVFLVIRRRSRPARHSVRR